MITKCLKVELNGELDKPSNFDELAVELATRTLVEAIASGIGTAKREQRLEVDEIMDQVDEKIDRQTGNVTLRDDQWAKITGWWMNSVMPIHSDWRRKFLQKLDKAVMGAGVED